MFGVNIGVGASKVLGVQKIFAQIFPNFPKKLSCNFADRFLVGHPKIGLHLFFCKHWASFCEVKERWEPFLPRFSEIWPRYLGICSDFQGFCPNF